jgi:hypothetical protein
MIQIDNPFEKKQKKIIEQKNWSFKFKFYMSKNKRPFRLSGIELTDSGYLTTIFWLDEEKYETFPFEKIEPYLL